MKIIHSFLLVIGMFLYCSAFLMGMDPAEEKAWHELREALNDPHKITADIERNLKDPRYEVNRPVVGEETSLDWVLRCSSPPSKSLVVSLLQRGALIKPDDIYYAVDRHHDDSTSTLEILLEHLAHQEQDSARPHLRSLLNESDALSLAASQIGLPKVDLLLQYGVDPNSFSRCHAALCATIFPGHDGERAVICSGKKRFKIIQKLRAEGATPTCGYCEKYSFSREDHNLLQRLNTSLKVITSELGKAPTGSYYCDRRRRQVSFTEEYRLLHRFYSTALSLLEK